jgi:IPT/TIG domain-containing protein/pre-peptidase
MKRAWQRGLPILSMTLALSTSAVVVLAMLLAASTSAAGPGGSEVEPNNSPSHATHLWCEVDESGIVNSGFDSDYFSFSHPVAGPFHVYTSTPDGGDPRLELFQGDGVTLVDADDDDGVAAASHIGIASLPAGDYFVRVSTFTVGDRFPYVLSLRCPANPVEIEPNDSPATATITSCDATAISGDIGRPGDVDYWSFSVPLASNVVVTSLPAPEGADQILTIYDESGAFVTSAVDGGNELGATLSATLTPGMYFVSFASATIGLHYDATITVAGRSCSTVTAITPSSGSSAGGDLVHVSGTRLGSAQEVSVLFGGVPATILSSTDTLVDVLTPAGSGTVDVTVVSRGESNTLAAAYAFRPPEIAARFGNVNVGSGDREDVLLVNAVTGDSARELTIGLRRPISIVMTPPTSRASARFALYVWPQAGTATTLTTLPRGLGVMSLPPPFVPASPQPVAIFNNVGSTRILGVPTLPSHPAPSLVLNSPGGARRPATITLQGVIQDDGSQIPERWSVTNAIVVRFE